MKKKKKEKKVKMQFEILQSELEFLERIKKLPNLIDKEIGNLPQSFPKNYNNFIERIRDLCEDLETGWKEWVTYRVIYNSPLNKYLKGKIIYCENEDL